MIPARLLYFQHSLLAPWCLISVIQSRKRRKWSCSVLSFLMLTFSFVSLSRISLVSTCGRISEFPQVNATISLFSYLNVKIKLLVYRSVCSIPVAVRTEWFIVFHSNEFEWNEMQAIIKKMDSREKNRKKKSFSKGNWTKVTVGLMNLSNAVKYRKSSAGEKSAGWSKVDSAPD